jgi:MFS transporter, SP family, sugar:H+ symporter
MIYETKGLTLEQVDEPYTEASSARKSVGWKPTITFREMRQASVEIQKNINEDKADGKEASHAME